MKTHLVSAMGIFIGSVLLGALVTSLLPDENLLLAGSNVHQLASVEIGLSELSPNGPGGGFAIPASGESCALGMQLSPDPVTNTGTVDVRFTSNPPQASNLTLYVCETDATGCVQQWSQSGYMSLVGLNNYPDINLADAGLTINKSLYLVRVTYSWVETTGQGEGSEDVGRNAVCEKLLNIAETPFPNLDADVRDMNGSEAGNWGPFGVGENATLGFTIFNYGSAEAAVSPTTIQYDYNNDCVNNVGPNDSCIDDSVQLANIGPIAIGESIPVTVSKTFATAGTYRSRLIANHPYTIQESTGTDNDTYWESFSVESHVPSVTIQACNTSGGGCTSGIKNITYGDEVIITWSSSNAESCTATDGSGFSTGGTTSGTDTSITEPTNGTQATYTVECTNTQGDSSSDSVIINPLPTLSFTVNPTNIAVGESVTLSWNTRNAVSCTASSDPIVSGWNGSKTPGQNKTQSLIFDTSGTYKLDLTCKNSQNDTVLDRVWINVGDLENCPNGGSLEADPTVIRKGNSSTLHWIAPTSAEQTCTITGSKIGDEKASSVDIEVSACGEQIINVSPLSTSDYTLTCNGVEQESATILVLPDFQET